ncbi:hypothetical protein C6538_30080 [Escherichia coli]|nr:hypothetical protein [Escherichia coli]
MLHDHLAECLEKKGLYRRAAERWAKVMVQLSDDQKRKVAAYLRALLPVTIRKSDFSGRFLCHI